MAQPKLPNRILLRLLLLYPAMLAAYMLSIIFIEQPGVEMSPEEASRAAGALFIVSLVYALVLSYIILRSPWRGWKLIDAVFFIQFGAETFMAQLETLYYNRALQMGMDAFWDIVIAGLIRALIFAPLAVLILGKFRNGEPQQARPSLTRPGWIGRIFAVALIYVLIYYMFGYFVAWQWEETRLYYTGSTAIKPFFTHFRDQFLVEDPLSLPFQLLRGLFWAFLTQLITRTARADRLEAALLAGVTFFVFLALPLGMFPNPYLPPIVARSHFIEISTSMLLFGGIAGWLLPPETESTPGGIV